MNILIVTFKFSPEDGVGGRRWRLLSEQLCKLGHNVTVVTSNASGVNCCDNLNVVELKFPFEGKFFFSLYKLLFRWLQRKELCSLLDLYEPWIKLNYNKVKKIIKSENVDVLIGSGHPCSINYYSSLLKKECPSLFLVQDFRDLWNQEVNYSLAPDQLGHKSKSRSLLCEAESLSAADLILNVSEGQRLKMMADFPKFLDKSVALYNGFLPEIYPSHPKVAELGGEYINLVHAGSIRWKGLDAIEAFFSALSRLIAERPNANFKVKFCGTTLPSGILNKYSDLINDICIFLPFLNQEELVSELQSSDYGMIFFDKDTGLGTKIFDYIGLNLPFIAVAPNGELREFCVSNDLYNAAPNSDHIYEMLLDLYESNVNNPVPQHVYEMFSIPQQAKQLDSCLKSYI